MIITQCINKSFKFLLSIAINGVLVIALITTITIALPIILVMSTILIAVILSLLLLFALFAYLHHVEEELKQKADEIIIQQRQDNPSDVNVFRKLPSDVIQYQIFSYMSHTELLTRTRVINKQCHQLVRDYYERNMLHDASYRQQVLQYCIQLDWHIDSSLAAQKALWYCVESSKVWSQPQKDAFKRQVASLESKSLIWTIYKKFLVYSNVSQWHDDILSVLNIYKYGVLLCCRRPRTFFKLISSGAS
jgi:signal transduction histidine kinase